MIHFINQIKNINILFTFNVMAKDLSSSQNLLVFLCPLIIPLRILFGIPLIIYKNIFRLNSLIKLQSYNIR